MTPADPATGSGTPGPDLAVEVFPPTLREVMLRPRWIALLLLCLVVAGVFAWLGQWQLGRAIQTDPIPPGASEEVRPIEDVTTPGAYLPEPLVGQRVDVDGWWIGEDFLIVESRFNDGVEGYWVTGQLRLWDGATGFDQTDEPASLAVALGWAPTREEAEAAASALEELVADGAPAEPLTLTGRLVSDEGPQLPPRGADPQTMTSMSSAALLGQWHDVDALAVYRPYLVSDDAPAGLTLISSPPPAEGSDVNWLNIFYAAEWAVFAGFAFYLWYRLAKDQWEKEVEDFEDATADPGDGAELPAS
jgi:surfeit locus 1 family protein